jgi:hypothetical protein
MRSLLPIALLLGSCSFSLSRESGWFTDYAWIDGETGTREGKLAVTEGMGPVSVALDASATAGDATWTLTAPDGTVRWRCHAGAAQELKQNCSFANEPGTWIVRREFRGFAGWQSFTVNAVGADEMKVEVTVTPGR